MFAIECKAMKSEEFNIKKLPSEHGIGRLEKSSSGKWWQEENKKDGVGQLRAYCMNYKCFSKEHSAAILTDGFDWVIFDNQEFVLESELSAKISKEAIKAHANLEDANFNTEIICRLKPVKVGGVL